LQINIPENALIINYYNGLNGFSGATNYFCLGGLMEEHAFKYVEIEETHGIYRVFLKHSACFIGNYDERVALLVAHAVELALFAQHPKCEMI
jgi:hypothetical protein